MNALPVAEEAFKIEWQQLRFIQPSDERGQKKSVVATVQAACRAKISPSPPNKNRNSDTKGIVVFILLWYNFNVDKK